MKYKAYMDTCDMEAQRQSISQQIETHMANLLACAKSNDTAQAAEIKAEIDRLSDQSWMLTTAILQKMFAEW